MNAVDVTVVGAGPTGLMAALLLVKSGMTVRIVDKSLEQAHESRAFGVHAKSLELLLSIGLAEDFLNAGLIATGIQIYVNSKLITELNFDDIGRDDTPYSFILMVPQYDIEKILSIHLNKLGIPIEHNTEVIDIFENDNLIDVTIKNNNTTSTFKTAFLIGADGAHSIVRKKIGASFEGAAYPEGFLLADCKINWPLDYAHMKIFLQNRSLAVYLPLKGKDYGRILSVKKFSNNAPDKQYGGSQKATLEEVQTAIDSAASGINVKLTDPLWVTAYRIHHRSVDQYQKNNIFLAGDAAHIHSPAGGQGMNTGLQDAANLIWKIVLVHKGFASKQLLNTYHQERWPVGQKILKTTDRMFTFMSSENLWLSKFRNLLVPIFTKIVYKFFRKNLFHFVSQLGIRYSINDFLMNDFSSKVTPEFKNKISAGRRIPNGQINRNIDLFSLLEGYCFSIVALANQSLTKEEIDKITADIHALPNYLGLNIKKYIIGKSLLGRNDKIIQAESKSIFQNLGITDNIQALLLIRPDGYIAYSSDSWKSSGLEKFLLKFNHI